MCASQTSGTGEVIKRLTVVLGLGRKVKYEINNGQESKTGTGVESEQHMNCSHHVVPAKAGNESP